MRSAKAALPPQRERGIILIAVLLAVAIMSVMVVAAAALTRAGAGSELLEQRRLNTHFALRSAVEFAKAQILAAPPDERVLFDGTEMEVAVGSTILASISIRDAAGLVDVNQSDPVLIEAMARGSGMPLKQVSDLAARIAKLRKDAAPAPTGAVPKAAGRPPSKAQPAKMADQAKPPGQQAEATEPLPVIFLSVDQLQALADIASEQGKSFASTLTVFNPTGRINPLAAPEAVLSEIPGMTPSDLSLIAEVKRSRKWKADARIAQFMERSKPALTLDDAKVFLIEVKLEPGGNYLTGSTARAAVRIGDVGSQPFHTLAMEEQ